jgi:hypothetical protein
VTSTASKTPDLLRNRLKTDPDPNFRCGRCLAKTARRITWLFHQETALLSKVKLKKGKGALKQSKLESIRA